MGRMRSQAHLLIRAQQHYVRQGGFHRITDPTRTLATAFGLRRQMQRITFFASVGQCAEITAMAWIDVERAGERSAEDFVSGDQRALPLVDLPVLALAALLHGLHDQQPDADADQGDDRQPDQGGEHGLPGAEIESTHWSASRSQRPD
ncbi:hypothetical protein D3C71_1237490 [compost metagenome]